MSYKDRTYCMSCLNVPAVKSCTPEPRQCYPKLFQPLSRSRLPPHNFSFMPTQQVVSKTLAKGPLSILMGQCPVVLGC